ncbi:quinon protein alcohol dehydrogenase-like superfamily [Hygrophoropsis aurantiaca]|uniref:Quinon protein alcohol dehydrogenase-like superfamily n=1 Tax=Hygrophoropsis aurantiaca TaxID=72124 RepID=A0ACB7ZRB2_9AGAM|nr:quinon protein alcohol dehydrogenase-like superfamily [Hygrophoropsis aurantiaca]
MSTSAPPKLEEDSAPRLPAKVFQGHSKGVTSVAYFSDGSRIASGSFDGTIRIWDVEDGTEETLETDSGVDTTVVIPPNGRTLVIGGQDQVFMWDLASRKMMWETEEGEVDGWKVAISPDGKLVAASHGDEIELLEGEYGKPIRERLQLGEEEPASCLAFSPDGTQLVVGSTDGKVRVFNVATGETVVGPIDAHTLDVSAAVFTFDGKQIITSSYDNAIRVWDTTTGHEVGDPMLGHENYINQSALISDGRRLASAADDGTVRVWDLNTRRQLGGSLQAQEKLAFFSVTGSPNGHHIVAGDEKGNIYLWDIPPLENTFKNPRPPFLPQAASRFQKVSYCLHLCQLMSDLSSLQTASRSRPHSLSSSLLDLPAGSIPSNTPKLNHRSRSDFFDIDSSLDLPTLGRPPKSAHKHSGENVDELTKARDKRNEPYETQPHQIDTGEIAPSQAVNSQPRPRRQRRSRRSEEIGMIAPAPGYDRYHSATEEYWYDPQNPPLIDRICFCMCFGVPKDDDNISNADADPASETNRAPPNTQAGPSQPTLVTGIHTSTPKGVLGRLWRRVSNLARRSARTAGQLQHESHELQNMVHATPQPSPHSPMIFPRSMLDRDLPPIPKERQQ